jgi:hypothetical protein
MLVCENTANREAVLTTTALGRPYRVEYQGNDLVVRVSSDLMSREEMIDLLDYIFLENVRQKASLSDAEVEAMAKDANRSAWERLRPMVEERVGRRSNYMDDARLR